jgi:hypothetical protein
MTPVCSVCGQVVVDRTEIVGVERWFHVSPICDEGIPIDPPRCQNRLADVKWWLAELLSDSMEATCTDFQYDHIQEFEYLLGKENVSKIFVTEE